MSSYKMYNTQVNSNENAWTSMFWTWVILKNIILKKGRWSKIHSVNMADNAICPPVSALYFFHSNEVLEGEMFCYKEDFFLSCHQIWPCDQMGVTELGNRTGKTDAFVVWCKDRWHRCCQGRLAGCKTHTVSMHLGPDSSNDIAGPWAEIVSSLSDSLRAMLMLIRLREPKPKPECQFINVG